MLGVTLRMTITSAGLDGMSFEDMAADLARVLVKPRESGCGLRLGRYKADKTELEYKYSRRWTWPKLRQSMTQKLAGDDEISGCDAKMCGGGADDIQRFVIEVSGRLPARERNLTKLEPRLRWCATIMHGFNLINY